MDPLPPLKQPQQQRQGRPRSGDVQQKTSARDLRGSHAGWAVAFDMFDKDGDGLLAHEDALLAFRRISGGGSVELPLLRLQKSFDLQRGIQSGKIDFCGFHALAEHVTRYMRENPQWRVLEEEALEEEERLQKMKQRELKRKESADLFHILGIQKTQDIKEAEARKLEAIGRSQSLGQLRTTGQAVMKTQKVVRRLNALRMASQLRRASTNDSVGHGAGERRSLLLGSGSPADSVRGSGAQDRAPRPVDLPSDAPAAARPATRAFGGLGAACFALRFSPDGSRLAGGFFDGNVRVFDVARRTHLHTLNLAKPTGMKVEQKEPERDLLEEEDELDLQGITLKASEKAAVTNLRWMPSSHQSILATVDITGTVGLWDLRRGREPRAVSTSSPGAAAPGAVGFELAAVAFTGDGRRLLVAGHERRVHVYDVKAGVAVHSGQVLGTQWSGSGKVAGHSLKVLSLAADPERPDVVVSGGLDKQVLLWDLRAGPAPVGNIRGTELGGDALELSRDGMTLLAGSHRSRNPLQLYDLRGLASGPVVAGGSGDPDRPPSATSATSAGAPAPPVVRSYQASGAVAASPGGETSAAAPSCMLFSAAWDARSNGTIVIAGENHNLGRVFQRPAAEASEKSLRTLATVEGRGRAVYAAAVAGDASLAAFGSADGSVRLLDLASVSGAGAGAGAASPTRQLGGA